MRRLIDRWFRLTANEQMLIGCILFLMVLGLLSRWWHLSQLPQLPAEIEQLNERF